MIPLLRLMDLHASSYDIGSALVGNIMPNWLSCINKLVSITQFVEINPSFYNCIDFLCRNSKVTRQ